MILFTDESTVRVVRRGYVRTSAGFHSECKLRGVRLLVELHERWALVGARAWAGISL